MTGVTITGTGCPIPSAEGVSTLVLTHLIPEPRTADGRQSFVDDVRSGGFEGELIVADDLATVEL